MSTSPGYPQSPPLPPVPQINIMPPSDASTIQTPVPAHSGIAGAAFGRAGSTASPASVTNASIAPVSISGRAYTGPVYDANGNRLN